MLEWRLRQMRKIENYRIDLPIRVRTYDVFETLIIKGCAAGDVNSFLARKASILIDTDVMG